MPDRASNTKKRGAPFGNTNALIHGYYSARLRSRSFNRARGLDLASVGDQLPLLRAYIDQVYDFSTRLENVKDGPYVLQALDASIAHLIQTMQSSRLDIGSFDEKEWARLLLRKFLASINIQSSADA